MKESHKSNKNAPFLNIGSASLLVVFLVLCLVIFAVLTLTSAQSDYRFSERLADRRTAYYTACNQAEEQIAALCADGTLSHLTEAYAFQVTINGRQALSVVLEPDGDGGFTVSSWQTVHTADWTPGNMEGM